MFFTETSGFRSGSFTIEPKLAADVPVLIGRFRSARLRDGLGLHVTDTEDLHDLVTSDTIEPGFSIYLFIECGPGLDVTIGDRALPIGRHGRGGEELVGFAMSWRQPVRFVRRAARGTRVRKILVTVSQEWLDETFGQSSAAVPAASREHLAISRWSPSRRLAAMAEALLEPDPRGTALSRLRDESTALELVGEALATLQPPTGAMALRRTDTIRLNRARDLIEGQLSSELSVAAIATELGMGPVSLQRLFRTAYDCSVFEYVRARRLDVARLLLEQGRSVAEAAEAAGYSSAANFATAFRRRFGSTPSQAREGIHA